MSVEDFDTNENVVYSSAWINKVLKQSHVLNEDLTDLKMWPGEHFEQVRASFGEVEALSYGVYLLDSFPVTRNFPSLPEYQYDYSSGMIGITIVKCPNTYIGIHLQDHEWLVQVLTADYTLALGHTGLISARKMCHPCNTSTHDLRASGDFNGTLHIVVINDTLAEHYLRMVNGLTVGPAGEVQRVRA